MTPEQAFRFGFLSKCAEEGVGPVEARRMLEMVEDGDAAKTAGVVDSTVGAAKGILGVGLPTVALGTVGVSGLLGYLAGRATNPPFNSGDAQSEELAETYRQNTERLRLARNGRARTAQAMQPRVA